MRLVAMLLGLVLSTPALAGGVGPLVMGGFHTEEVYFYSSQLNGGQGVSLGDPTQYEQYSETQLIGNVGAGLELILGDRDDLIQGVFRGYWMMDFPQALPTTGELVDDDALVLNIREEATQIGVGTVGMNFGIVRAANNKFRFAIGAHLGSGFATSNHTEFFLAQADVSLNYLITRTLEIYADVGYGLRVRKSLSHGLYGTAGLRVMFDCRPPCASPPLSITPTETTSTCWTIRGRER